MVAAREPETAAETNASWYSRVRESGAVRKLLQILAELLPKGLYARALLIIITPIVVLEGVIAFAFMERHWQAVTRRLSESTARDIAALIDVYDELPQKDNPQRIIDLARDRLGLQMEVLPSADLPPPGPKPFFALLDRALSNELRRHVKMPFWIDTVGETKNVEIRVKHDDGWLGMTGILDVFTRSSRQRSGTGAKKDGSLGKTPRSDRINGHAQRRRQSGYELLFEHLQRAVGLHF